MLLRDRKSFIALFLAGFALMLAACGFTPMYGSAGSHTAAAAGLDQIRIDMIPDESGVFLRNELIDRFYQNGYPASPRYRLRVGRIVEQIQNFDITVESEATRKQIRLSAPMVLIDLESGEEVLSRNLVAVGSHNVAASQFATRVSETDSREGALRDLARQIETQIALYLKR